MRIKKLQLHTSRLVVLFLCLILVVSAVPTVRADGENGSCGTNLQWTLSAGTLTISGSGEMEDFPEETMAPWYSYRKQILRLELPEGLTSIGELAFYECTNLTTVVIPDSVKTIGKHAFAECYGLQILNLGSGVTSIADGAFFNCRDLVALKLPESLKQIGSQCFYRMESLTSVTIPSNVTSIGTAAFAYCINLVSVEIQAPISDVPAFMFYKCARLNSVSLPKKTELVDPLAFHGCDQLNTVYYGGSSATAEEIQNVLGNGQVVNEVPPKTSSSIITTDNEDGTFTQNNTTVTQEKDIFISSSVQNTGNQYGADIDVTLESDAGWNDALKLVDEQINGYLQSVEKSEGKSEHINVNLYVKDVAEMDAKFMDALAKRENVTVTVKTQDGSIWRAESDLQNNRFLSGNYDLRYTLTQATAEMCDQLGMDVSFCVQFHESAEINAKVMIRLGDRWKNQTATLFQYKDDALNAVQTSVVDQDGYVSFYLASISSKTNYYIAMGIAATDESSILEAQALQNYNEVEAMNEVQYVVTGRKSSWGMNLGQVMGILAVVMVSVVVIVGVVMSRWNKKRLQNGYVPEWEDEDE